MYEARPEAGIALLQVKIPKECNEELQSEDHQTKHEHSAHQPKQRDGRREVELAGGSDQ